MSTSNNSALAGFLQRLLLRSALSQEEQAAILNLKSHAAQVGVHRDIVSPGQKVAHACLVVDGLVARFDQMKDGRRQITALHIPGDMCDLHSVVSPVAGWGLGAITTSTILRVPHEELRAATLAYPAIAMAFWRDTTADASVLAKWVANVGRKDALARLAHLFCEIGMRMEQAGLGIRTSYPLAITQAQVADALGLTPVHVNRTLKSLRESGLLRTDQRGVQIENWGRLADIAEFNPEFLLIEPLSERQAA